MAQVSYRTGLVVIPPQPAWPPIQAIRAEHDRKVLRWMPLPAPPELREQAQHCRPASGLSHAQEGA